MKLLLAISISSALFSTSNDATLTMSHSLPLMQAIETNTEPSPFFPCMDSPFTKEDLGNLFTPQNDSIK